VSPDRLLAIVLTIVSMIQSFAVAGLAEQLDHLHSTAQWCAFALVLFVIFRVFQGYVAAAIDYGHWEISFIDIPMIFTMIGKLPEHGFTGRGVEIWFLALSAAAALGHLRALVFVTSTSTLAPNVAGRERSLQIVNVVVAAAGILLAALAIAGDAESVIIGAMLVQTLLLAWNIHTRWT
jgi:hypothetical protein